MNRYTLGEIADVISGKLIGNNYSEIDSLALDSRTVVPSDSQLFFCIRGERHDSHKYIEELCEKGIRNFVVEYVPEGLDATNINYVLVDDSIASLQEIAAFHRTKFTGDVIGITGSNGKTIVKEWLWQCLRSKYKVVRSPKSYNSQVGVPLSAWLLNKESDIGILEAGISLSGEMKNLQKIINPEIGIFTNIGEAHQEGFSDYSQKVIEKATLFENSKILIYSKDYRLIANELRNRFPNKVHLDWSSKSEDAWLKVKRIKTKDGLTTLQFKSKHLTGEIKIPFSDNASIENVTHVLSVLLHLKFSFSEIQNAIAELQPVAMRLELKKGINNCTIINDSYNSDFNSLDIALDFLNLQVQHSKKTLILSDILQTGKSEDELYREVSQKIKEKNIDRLIGIGDAIYRNRDQFGNGVSFYKSTQEFLDKPEYIELKNEAILLKGSRNFQFEKIASLLEEKKHTTVLEINLNAIVHNLNFYRSLIKRDTKILVMLKAFSYGSGSYEIASILQNQRVDYFGVAFADEGITLRKNGIQTPVMVMSPSASDFEMMTIHRLEPEIHSFELLHEFYDYLVANQILNYPIHIKIDTGMHRLGFQAKEIDKLLEILKGNQHLRVASVFSHLAASDEPDEDSFTNEQITAFEKVADKLKSTLNIHFLRHILHNNGIERFSKAQYEMVRLGIGLYGVSNVFEEKVQNVSTFKSKIVQIKYISKGETIGYGRRGIAEKETRIATIPIGYADGLDRKLSNGNWCFLVNGKLAPIIGNVCMDLCMIDISEIEVAVGDEVVVFGGKPKITELAKQLDTIPYEILTKVSQRVKRIYIHE